ncbi:MAG: T9SS type A sorting domain-containing protein [Saprospiraceae bacterium]|nr:T9SS type A sorting domain-containing protein [Saprospiraceae bacterium]
MNRLLVLSSFILIVLFSNAQKTSNIEIPNLLQPKELNPDSRFESLITQIQNAAINKKQIISTKNPTYKLDSAYFLSAWADTVLSLLGRTIYSFDQNQNLVKFEISAFDSLMNKWIYKVKREFTYNSNGLLTSWRQSFMPTLDSNWIISEGEDFTYNANDSLTEYIVYRWPMGYNAMIPYWKEETFYDSTGFKSYSLSYWWKTATLKWDKNSKSEFTYDSLGYLSKYEIFEWKQDSSNWKTGYRYKYVHDSLGNMTQKIESMGYMPLSPWYDFNRIDFHYNFNSELDSMCGFKKDSFGVPWYRSNRVKYFYDSLGNMTQAHSTIEHYTHLLTFYSRQLNTYNAFNNLIESLNQKWDSQSNSWVNDSKRCYQFDSGQNHISECLHNWDTTISAWDSYLFYTASYDLNLSSQDILLPNYLSKMLSYPSDNNEYYYLIKSNNNMLSNYSQFYKDFPSGVHYEKTRYTFYYSPLTASISEKINKSKLKIYPNPAKSKVNIILPDKLKGTNTLLEIYDVQGRILQKLQISKNSQDIVVDVFGFNVGVYILKLQSNGTAFVEKIIVE